MHDVVAVKIPHPQAHEQYCTRSVAHLTTPLLLLYVSSGAFPTPRDPVPSYFFCSISQYIYIHFDLSSLVLSSINISLAISLVRKFLGDGI